MWNALIKLIEKFACMHDYEVVRTSSYTDCNRHLLICKKCGKIVTKRV